MQQRASGSARSRVVPQAGEGARPRVRRGDPEAVARVEETLGERARERFRLSDAQWLIAREHGFRSWGGVRALGPGAWARGATRRCGSTAGFSAAAIGDRVRGGACVAGRAWGGGARLGPSLRRRDAGARARRQARPPLLVLRPRRGVRGRRLRARLARGGRRASRRSTSSTSAAAASCSCRRSRERRRLDGVAARSDRGGVGRLLRRAARARRVAAPRGRRGVRAPLVESSTFVTELSQTRHTFAGIVGFRGRWVRPRPFIGWGARSRAAVSAMALFGHVAVSGLRLRPGAEVRRELGVAGELGPPGRVAAVELVAERRVGSELEQRLDRLALARLRGEMQRGHALAVIRPAERAALVRVGAELDQPADRGDAAVRRRPRERRAPVGIGVHARTELDEQRRSPRRGPPSPPRRAPRRAPPAGRPTAPTPGSRRAAGRSRGARRPPACRRARGSARAGRARPRRAGCRARARAGRRPRGGPRRAPR